jgi:hypothetical protein
MAMGKDRNPEEVTQILTTYAITDNLRETSRQTGIPLSTVKVIVDRHRDTPEFKQLCTQKREEFSQRASRIVFKGLTLLERRYDKALDNEDDLEGLIDLVMSAKDEDMSYKERMDLAKKLGRLELNTLSEITTSMGTLFDKMRLANGESTENSSQTITVTMSKELEELSK